MVIVTRQKPPSSGDRHGRSGGRAGKPVGIAMRGRVAKAAPELNPGQVRCPVCRNGVTTTPFGFLRRHRDLFGHDCHNKSVTR